jgi:hypothetical protein
MMTLLNWPDWSKDSGYRDSGEGGLFAYAVWAAPKAECSVDVRPSLFKGDVLVNAIGPLRAEFDAQERRYRNGSSGADVNYKDLTLSTAVTLGTVVFLGSTAGSFFDDRSGEYFIATETALTETGIAVVSNLEAIYGEATFLTYLDT